ncbi:MAG: VOC family protein [Myxococcota bacterium]|nr:VOC family protein [Myxococcota bacterium]
MSYDYGKFNWFELVTTDVERAVAFYPETLPWKAKDAEMPGFPYTLLMHGETSVGGLTAPQQEGTPSHWLSYVSVEDVDATAKKVAAHGGKVLADAFEVPSVGRMQPVMDPEGAPFVLFHAAEGEPPATEGAGSWHWNERWAKDPEKLAGFYAQVLGYSHDVMEMPNGPYFIFKNGEKMRGGMMKAPSDEMPSVWLQYVTVDDADATLARAERNGATPLGEPMTVPGVGRFAMFADPTGAVLGVITPDA